MPRDLDLGSGHMVYLRASLIDVYLHAKFKFKFKLEMFCGQTYALKTVISVLTQFDVDQLH